LLEAKVEVTEQQMEASFNRIANAIAAYEKQQGNTRIK
jgi:hypothetical protein